MEKAKADEGRVSTVGEGNPQEGVSIDKVKDGFSMKINKISSGQTISLVITGGFAYEVSLKGSHTVQRRGPEKCLDSEALTSYMN